MKIEKFTFNPFQENTYLIYTDEGEAVVVDPGCIEDSEKAEIDGFISQHNLVVRQVWLTHGHIDHVLGCYHFRIKHDAQVFVPEHDLSTFDSVKLYAPSYGFPKYQPVKPDGLIHEGDTMVVGSNKFEVIFTPGHAPGHVVFYSKENKLVVNGDVLFAGSIGRFDLPGGDQQTLYKTIQEKMYALPEETLVYCGHGPETTIGKEKATNPFVQGK
jgi:glyoxylase-like metal-dependent hydrolase (beta-lactamase superfamily II)